MDAPALPVLSTWTADPAAAAPSGAPAGLVRVDGVAASPEAALARARSAYPGRDVLLLRAGVTLHDAALQRLLAAWHGSGWDVLSPLDGRWALGEGDADALAWSHGEHAAFAWRGWSAECSLWRAGATPSAFERGALLPCVQVGQAARVADAEAPLPVQALRERARRGGRAARPGQPTLLHVLHGWGGGAERFVRDLAAADSERTHLVLVARGDQDKPPFGRRLCLHADLDAPPLHTWELSAPVVDCAAHSPEVATILATLKDTWGVGAVLVSSLVGHGLDVLRTGLPTALCTHDAFPLWPLLHDARDPEHDAFDHEALAAQLAAVGPGFVFAGRDAGAWWALRDALLAELAARDILLVAPSDFARRRLCALAPALAERRWQVIGHGLAPLPAVPPLPEHDAPRHGRPLRVLVAGRVHGAKGQQLLDALLPRLPAGVELVLLGTGPVGERYFGRSGVHVLKDYARDELPRWVAALRPDLAMLPSTVPETWSYTLSELWALGLPVLCADLGAPGERLRAAGGGWRVTSDAAAFADALAKLAADPDAVAFERARVPAALPGLDAMARAWRAALPVAAPALRLPAADPDAPARLRQALALAAEAAHADALHQQLAAQQDELDRRADWAFSLQAELRRGEARREQAEAALQRARHEAVEAAHAAQAEQARLADEITALEQNLHQIERQLAESHGYYQRDTTDLARQRDIALAQRDEVQQLLDHLRTSLAWRLTGVPRRLARSLRLRGQALAFHARHLLSLTERGLASLRSRGVAGTLRRMRERRAHLAQARVVPALPVPSPGDIALRLPRPSAPRASIIVPVYNQLALSLACLRALADCGDAASFEVIVVDDGSSDDTPNLLPSVSGLRYHRNPRNLGFIGACNAGAALAQGEFLVFLNNDTTVQPGWLDALLATFRQHPDTGLAGSKLVYPDGRLQEAGGIVFADGSGWNYGRFDDPAHPRYNFVREVDYCSGAAIALRRELFDQLGGFDPLYAPAYYEDTDLAMRVRQHGLKVRYQPASVVVHHEGATAGTDLGSGVKAYQVANQKKFLARWREVLQRDHLPAGTDPETACERGRRHRVLVLDACTPTPDRDSGSVRMLALMRLLREEGCSVVFFPENRAHDGRYTHELQQLGVEAWWHPWVSDVPKWLAQHGARFDLVIGSRHYVLAPALPLLRSHAPRATVVFDTVDLHHLREQREAELAGDPARLRAAARTRKIELELIAQSDLTWVVSHAEQALLAAEMPSARVEVVSNIHDDGGAGPGFAAREGLLFVGSYRHPPNVDAARWLADEILPRLREREPGLRLHLVGGDAPPEVEALGGREGIEFHGYVPDLDPLLRSARVALAPLRYGAGVKGKVNQALAHGLPVVATTCAVEGMHLREGEDVLVADDAAGFADAVLRAYDDPALWARLSEGGLENTRRHFSPEVVRGPLRALLGSLRPR
jgi:GT2 family glycosyltransferase/glycosyltransferase involved in cell wall biosynthesis